MTVRQQVMPVTIPVVDPTVATDGALLCHVPPGVRSIKDVVVPGQRGVVPPVMVAGIEPTVTETVA